MFDSSCKSGNYFLTFEIEKYCFETIKKATALSEALNMSGTLSTASSLLNDFE